MSTQVEQVPPKRPKLLACARCRHRKQKCTETRPCANCTQSGAECTPARLPTSKLPLEHDYVRRLEERIAQLESIIPQESLDHIDAAQHHDTFDHLNAVQPQQTLDNINVAPLQENVHLGIDAQSRDQLIHETTTENQPLPSTSHSYQDYTAQLDSPVHNEAAIPVPAPLSLAFTPPEHLSPGLFGGLSNVSNMALPAIQNHSATAAALELDLEMERFLTQTYFDMAHSQYPLLLKHQFLQMAETWRNSRDVLPVSERWNGFFVYMVYAIAYMMTKARINGQMRSQALYTLATTKYLPYVVASPDLMIRAQGFLLLTVYALHVPSQENIITLSSWTIRFCIMSQLHLAETEPQPVNRDALIQIQHRRRIFWCAYAIERAVCSSYDFPTSIPDNHITVPVFENIDDDQLLSAASSTQPGSHLVGSSLPTNISPAIHVLASRRLESEIQEVVLGKDFIPNSDVAFAWRAKILEKVKKWNRRSRTSSEPSQKGYVSQGWLKMIYYYNIIMLYRPTRTVAQGLAGDWSVQASCQALLLFRKFQMAKEIAQPWLGLLTQFQIGVTLLYCLYATPTSRWKPSYKSADVSDAIRACSSTLAILAERWAEAECVRDVFEILAREIPLGVTWERPTMMSETGKAGIEENWQGLSNIVIHRPTLRMIQEMATEPFIDHAELISEVNMESSVDLAPQDAAFLEDELNLQWVDPTNDMGTRFDSSTDLDTFSDQMYF
ncbi:fungal-specific transcription factor domain-containing protein [Dactylonectria macrodidyma]|uniref:Fungal-specific transcription factor domain-containing protein n=1 Tax=Dactylonectria macrodidyma TaxID=307937 RepID=A0A9P9JP79_9HYPO|nr:fungal-specific transcription factor domain-containing protein [Dactylonectria macrodidyma]